MRFGFVTCVQLGLACMEEIYRAGGRLDVVFTLLDEQARGKSGRVYVDQFCRQHDIPVIKGRNVNDAAVVEAVRAHQLDWLFIIGWSQIARRELLRAPARGVLGMHPTLLPVGRGRAAIPWAILKGLSETGVTLFQLDEGVDTGPVLAQHKISVAPAETATDLYEKVQQAHRLLIREVWASLEADLIRPVAQDESKATTWPARAPEDGRITADMTVQEVERLVRAVTHPYPGAFLDRDGHRLRIWQGRVVSERGQSADGKLIRFRDGEYEATDYAFEPIPETSSQS
jgi:methionyl-tRNA formyltransferase